MCISHLQVEAVAFYIFLIQLSIVCFLPCLDISICRTSRTLYTLSFHVQPSPKKMGDIFKKKKESVIPMIKCLNAKGN